MANTALELLQQIQRATLVARERDRFAYRGQLCVAVENGKGRVQRITYDESGKPSIKHKSAFVPLELVASELNAESQLGVL